MNTGIVRLKTILQFLPAGVRLCAPADKIHELGIDLYASEKSEKTYGVGYSTPEEEASYGLKPEWVFERLFEVR